MIYIYRYKNKITNNSYIGKTNNVERRHREHISNSENPNSNYYNSLWCKKIRQYGIENFEFSILEEVDEKNWKEREKYWIKRFNSFDGKGYNSTEGGDGSENLERILTKEESESLIQELQDNLITQSEIAVKYEISETLVSNINFGIRYKIENIEYPIRKNYKNKKDYQELFDLLMNTTLSFEEIAKRLNMGVSTVKKINYGSLNKKFNMDYPIRKESGTVQKAKRVKELLLKNYRNKDIIKEVGVSDKTIRRINRGETHYDTNLNYPLRK